MLIGQEEEPNDIKFSRVIVRVFCFIVNEIGNYGRALAGERHEPVYIVKHYLDVSVVWTQCSEGSGQYQMIGWTGEVRLEIEVAVGISQEDCKSVTSACHGGQFLFWTCPCRAWWECPHG